MPYHILFQMHVVPHHVQSMALTLSSSIGDLYIIGGASELEVVTISTVSIAAYDANPPIKKARPKKVTHEVHHIRFTSGIDWMTHC